MFLRSLSGRRCYSSKWQAAAAKLSIGQCFQSSNELCPARNTILGEHFFTLAVRLALHTDPNTTEDDRRNTRYLHQQCEHATQRLTFSHLESTVERDEKIKLPTTGEYLPEDITKALIQWKYNAFGETKSILEHREHMSETKIENAVASFNLSLIGWYLQKYGMINTFELIEWLGIPIRTNTNGVATEFFAPVKSPLAYSTDENKHGKLENLLRGYEDVEKKLNYTFRDKSFLLQAFSHKSFTANDICPQFDSLDFVGDGVMNYLLCRHFFRDSRRFSAHEIDFFTRLLKSNACFAIISIRHEIYKYIRLTDTKIHNSLASFVKFIQKNQCKPMNDLYFLARNGYVVEVPPIVPDNFEALAAAIYFDSAMNLNVVANTMINLMQKDIEFTCETRPKSAFEEIAELDRDAYFSKPNTIGPGKITVQVTLPKFGNQTFSSISRHPDLAKWGAAKAALLQLKKQFNEYVPYKASELVK